MELFCHSLFEFQISHGKNKKTKNEYKSIDMALFFVVDFLLIFCISFICGINENSAWLALVVFFAGVIVNFLSYVFAWITSCGIVKVCYFIYGVKMD